MSLYQELKKDHDVITLGSQWMWIKKKGNLKNEAFLVSRYPIHMSMDWYQRKNLGFYLCYLFEGDKPVRVEFTTKDKHVYIKKV
jgi:hypothetical protein